MSNTRPFIFKFNAAELFAQIQPLNVEEKAAFIDQLSIDLLTLKARTEYAQQLIDETIKLIDTKRENGKKGGRPKNQKKAKVKLKKPEVNSSLSYKDKDNNKIKEEKEEKPYSEIINDLNQKGAFRYTANQQTKELINGRLAEGFTKDDFFLVHSNMIAAWKDDPKMSQYLRPDTLYRPSKFQGYLNQKPPKNTCVTPDWF